MDPTTQSVNRLLHSIERLSTPAYLAAVGGAFAVSFAAVLALDGDGAAHHLLHLPVVLVAGRWSTRGGVLAGMVAAGLSALATTVAEDRISALWLAQGLAFIAVGWLIGWLVAGRSAPTLPQDELAMRERELSDQRHDLLQLVSHELRTPLTVIRGNTETLRRHGAVAERFTGLIDATDRSVRRLEEMLEVMLAAVEELDAGEAEQTEVRVADIVVDAATSLQLDLPGRLHLEVGRTESVVTVEPYLWLTLRCLLDNAAKFTPPREDIVVTIERCGDTATICLRDRGPGLPDGFEIRAFEPFTQADAGVMRAHPGIGMGLYTARRLARHLGGDVTIDKAVDGGAIAKVTLPQRRDADPAGMPRHRLGGRTDRRTRARTVRVP